MQHIYIIFIMIVLCGCSRFSVSESNGTSSVIEINGDQQANVVSILVNGKLVKSDNKYKMPYYYGDYELDLQSGDNAIRIILNTGEKIEYSIKGGITRRIVFWPKRDDAFVEKGGYVVVYPFAVITWPIWGPIMMINGGG